MGQQSTFRCDDCHSETTSTDGWAIPDEWHQVTYMRSGATVVEIGYFCSVQCSSAWLLDLGVNATPMV